VAKRRRSTTTLKINKYTVGTSLIILGFIFFFSKFAAPDAPIFSFLSNYASIAFGQIGLVVFFALCIVMGILIMFKGYLMKTLLKQFALLMFTLSGILNFPAMSEELENGVVNRLTSNQYGGYFSRPLIKLLEAGLGDSIIAIKIIIVICTLVVIVRIFYALNVKLPALPKVSMEHYEKPLPRHSERSEGKPFITRETKITSDAELLKKVEKATGTAFATTGTIGTKNADQLSGSLLKDILKKKLVEKVDQKKVPEAKPRPQIRFSGDKPTFPYSLLESNLGQSTNIDQNFIVEKAKSLQNKLMEFGIPVSVEGFDIGPSIVQIKIKPAEGIKIASIENLTNDIKLSLKSKSLRIIAPIP
jgi:hypothetical protein